MRALFNTCVAIGAVAFGACVLDFDQFEGSTDDEGGGGGIGGSGGAAGQGNVGMNGGTGGVPESCTNNVLDGAESDVDCGGGLCPLCVNGEDCNSQADCRSAFCNAGVCAPCDEDLDCDEVASRWCDLSLEGGTCVPKEVDGQPCVGMNECISNECVDDVCCSAICNASCQACSAALTGGTNGVCANVVGTTDPDDDCGLQVCDGAGNCADLCNLEPAPPGGVCPGICDGGCAGNVCTINCGTNDCSGDTLECPDGFACALSCNGTNACNGAVINCPAAYACDVTCSGNNACNNLDLNCAATATCSLLCSTNDCDNVIMTCGDNACSADCPGVQSNFTYNQGTTCAPLNDCG